MSHVLMMLLMLLGERTSGGMFALMAAASWQARIV